MKTLSLTNSTYIILLSLMLASGCTEELGPKTPNNKRSPQKDVGQTIGKESNGKSKSASSAEKQRHLTSAQKERNATIQMTRLQWHIEIYYEVLGVYPKTLEGLAKPPNDAASREKWEAAGSPGIVDIPADLWGQKYQYKLLTKDSYRIWSMGPDGRNNTEDDIIVGADNANLPAAKRLDIATAKKLIQILAHFVENYATDMGELPQDFEALKMPPDDKELASKWKGPYMKVEIDIDPWGYPYSYHPRQGTFFILSNGPDTVSGDADDISSDELIHPRAE